MANDIGDVNGFDTPKLRLPDAWGIVWKMTADVVRNYDVDAGIGDDEIANAVNDLIPDVSQVSEELIERALYRFFANEVRALLFQTGHLPDCEMQDSEGFTNKPNEKLIAKLKAYVEKE